jgi:CelD/BcsL family acetyltransferase involved in cellulose biosynthesis
MIRLSADGRAVAIYYGLAVGTWWGYYLAGYDREWAGRIHLGRLTVATAIEQATRHGAREFDFLKGAEPVKYRWPVDERTTVDADIASHHSTAQLTRAAHAARETAAALAKSAARAWTRHR